MLGIIVTIGVVTLPSLVKGAFQTEDSTLTDIGQTVTWERGSFSTSGAIMTKTSGSDAIRTVAAFTKEQIFIEAKRGYSFKTNEVIDKKDGSHEINRRYSSLFRVPYGTWMKSGDINVYTDRLCTIEIKRDDGSAVSTADAEDCVYI